MEMEIAPSRKVKTWLENVSEGGEAKEDSKPKELLSPASPVSWPSTEVKKYIDYSKYLLKFIDTSDKSKSGHIWVDIYPRPTSFRNEAVRALWARTKLAFDDFGCPLPDPQHPSYKLYINELERLRSQFYRTHDHNCKVIQKVSADHDIKLLDCYQLMVLDYKEQGLDGAVRFMEQSPYDFSMPPLQPETRSRRKVTTRNSASSKHGFPTEKATRSESLKNQPISPQETEEEKPARFHKVLSDLETWLWEECGLDDDSEDGRELEDILVKDIGELAELEDRRQERRAQRPRPDLVELILRLPAYPPTSLFESESDSEYVEGLEKRETGPETCTPESYFCKATDLKGSDLEKAEELEKILRKKEDSDSDSVNPSARSRPLTTPWNRVNLSVGAFRRIN
jgi:hypothetical protein